MEKDRTDNTPPDDSVTDRAFWIQVTKRIGTPVLAAAAERRLKQAMRVEVGPKGSATERGAFANLEAVGRLLAGLAPWLELPDGVGDRQEDALRSNFRQLAREAIRSGVDPNSPDCFTIDHGPQPLVDAAFLAVGLLRAPTSLWAGLEETNRSNVLEVLRRARRFQPYFNNWLLFAAAIETFLLRVGEPDWDPIRIDYALRQHEQWYRGDSIYGDGPEVRWDYYNSFVTHPFLVEIIDVVADHVPGANKIREGILRRATRFAEIQERMIAPDGTYPPVGRSLTYRFGAFHALAQAALRDLLPTTLYPGQVRSALTSVIRRQMEAPGTFADNGWLTIGLAGHQPTLGESYITTGSLYLCANGLLPLGLPPQHAFWSSDAQPWTSVRAWSGVDIPSDKALRS